MRSHHNLLVWQKARELVKNIYQLCKEIPKEEMFGLTQQLKRAAVSIPANISEGMGRHTIKDSLRFFYISKGSIYEIETLIIISFDLQFLTKEKANELTSQSFEISKMLSGLIKNYESRLKEKAISLR